MLFNDVVTGSSLQPESAPEIMQPIIKAINDRTVEEVHRAIRSNLLENAWKVNGGWSNWLYSIVKGVVKIVGAVLDPSTLFKRKDSQDFENRLVDYFQSKGYDNKEALEMSGHIATELNSSS